MIFIIMPQGYIAQIWLMSSVGNIFVNNYTFAAHVDIV